MISALFKSKSSAKPFVIPGQTGLRSPYHYKKRFVLVGTVGAGKSSVITALYLTAMTLSAQVEGFICNVIEGASNILDDVSRLRRGYYPIKTDPLPYPIEPGLVLTWKTMWGERNLQIPTCDVSGETYHYMMQREKGVENEAEVMVDQSLIGYLEQADALLPVVAASRALMFPDDLRLEKVPKDLVDKSISEDDDVNLARIINTFQLHKQQAHKQIDAVGLIIHKWDLIKPYAQKAGMDVYDPSGKGFKKFMDVCYPTTSMALKRLTLQGKVKIFPSHIETLRDADGNVVKWSNGDPRVATLRDVGIQGERMPLYSEQTYIEFFNWAKNYAG